jgi:hypothetical protein
VCCASDAHGTTFEFKPPGTFRPITDMIGGGPFRLDPSQRTDGASMAFYPVERTLKWWEPAWSRRVG